MKKNINEEIFKGYFLNHAPLILAKGLYNNNQNVNDEIEWFTDWIKKKINTKKIRKNKNPNKIVDAVEKILTKQ